MGLKYNCFAKISIISPYVVGTKFPESRNGHQLSRLKLQHPFGLRFYSKGLPKSHQIHDLSLWFRYSQNQNIYLLREVNDQDKRQDQYLFQEYFQNFHKCQVLRIKQFKKSVPEQSFPFHQVPLKVSENPLKRSRSKSWAGFSTLYRAWESFKASIIASIPKQTGVFSCLSHQESYIPIIFGRTVKILLEFSGQAIGSSGSGNKLQMRWPGSVKHALILIQPLYNKNKPYFSKKLRTILWKFNHARDICKKCLVCARD